MDWVYGGYESIEPAEWSRFYETRAVVTPLNASASKLNEKMLEGLPSDAERLSLSQDYAVIDEGEAEHYTPEFMNSLDPPGMPPHELRIRPGALMMVLRNYAPQKGLCNGTRVVIRGLWRRLLQVQIVTGPKRGNVELLPRIVCDSTGDDELPFVLRRMQFPVRPAWVMSINKAQGQTVAGRIGVYLPAPVFAHGQLYVACSRATRASNVRVLVEDSDDKQRKLPCRSAGSDRAVAYTLNLVDRTLLCDSDPAPDPESVCQPCISERPVTVAQGPSCELDERYRLADILPDAVSSPVCSPLHWKAAEHHLHPFAADEWAVVEAGAFQGCGGNVGSSLEQVPLDQREVDDIEYVSEDEDIGSVPLELGVTG